MDSRYKSNETKVGTIVSKNVLLSSLSKSRVSSPESLWYDDEDLIREEEEEEEKRVEGKGKGKGGREGGTIVEIKKETESEKKKENTHEKSIDPISEL